MKMNPIKNKLVKGNMSSLLFILVFLPLINLSAQNYVGSGGELFSGSLGYNLGTTSDWSTVRSSAPGYYSWASGTNTSSYTGLSKDNNINGYVKKYGTDAFKFPIGTGTEMRTLSIDNRTTGGSVTDTYAAAWIAGNPTDMIDPTNSDAKHDISSVSGIIVGVSDLGQWDWQAISGSGEGLGITVSIPEISATGVFTDASNLRLVGWDGTVWKALGTEGASGLTNYSTLSGTMVAGIQAIGIGAACGAGTDYPTIK